MKISSLEPVQKFCSLMMSISSCPPSSAGIERLFSSAGLIQTKLRNRLSNECVTKLIHVYRHFGWKEPKDKEDDIMGRQTSPGPEDYLGDLTST